MRSFNLALAAGVKRLSDAYGADGLNPMVDIPYRQLIITSAGAAAYIGGEDVTTSVYGFTIPTTLTQGISLGPFEAGPLKLSNFYAVGAGATLHILGVPF